MGVAHEFHTQEVVVFEAGAKRVRSDLALDAIQQPEVAWAHAGRLVAVTDDVAARLGVRAETQTRKATDLVRSWIVGDPVVVPVRRFLRDRAAGEDTLGLGQPAELVVRLYVVDASSIG